MKWLKIPLEDEVYFTLKLMADVTGSSPEEIITRTVTGGLKTYTKFIAEGREEELRQLLLSSPIREGMKEASMVDMPEEPRLWTP